MTFCGLAEPGSAVAIELIEQNLREALISDAIAGAEDRLVFAQPGQRPRHADHRREIVILPAPWLQVGMRRVLADQLQRGQVIEVFDAGLKLAQRKCVPETPNKRLRSADDGAEAAIAFPRYAVIIPAHARREG